MDLRVSILIKEVKYVVSFLLNEGCCSIDEEAENEFEVLCCREYGRLLHITLSANVVTV